jgi:hypothetical protein
MLMVRERGATGFMPNHQGHRDDFVLVEWPQPLGS